MSMCAQKNNNITKFNKNNNLKMNKTFSAILMLCIISSSVAIQVDMEECFTQAATFTHTVKNVIAAAEVSLVGVSELLNAVYESSE